MVYGDIGVVLSPALGFTVSIVPVSGQSPDTNVPGAPRPAHIAFSISRLDKEQRNVPGPWRSSDHDPLLLGFDL